MGFRPRGKRVGKTSQSAVAVSIDRMGMPPKDLIWLITHRFTRNLEIRPVFAIPDGQNPASGVLHPSGSLFLLRAWQ
jgi:hypothetical protein